MASSKEMTDEQEIINEVVPRLSAAIKELRQMTSLPSEGDSNENVQSGYAQR